MERKFKNNLAVFGLSDWDTGVHLVIRVPEKKTVQGKHRVDLGYRYI